MVGDGGGPFNAPRIISGPVWSFTTAGGDPVPAAPGSLARNAGHLDQIDLTWNDVAGEPGYKNRTQTGERQHHGVGPGRDDRRECRDLPEHQRAHAQHQLPLSGSGLDVGRELGLQQYGIRDDPPRRHPRRGRILADAYVRAGQFANTNYGTATELISKFALTRSIGAKRS